MEAQGSIVAEKEVIDFVMQRVSDLFSVVFLLDVNQNVHRHV